MKRKKVKTTNKVLKKEIKYLHNMIVDNRLRINIVSDAFYKYLVMKGELESFKEYMEEKSNEHNGENSEGDGKVSRKSI
jgi:hypothetical protein